MRREIHIHKQPYIIFYYYVNISVLLATIIQKKLTNNFELRIVNTFSVAYEPDRMVRKASDVSAGD